MGGTNGIVSEFAFDIGTDNSNNGMYYPNVDILNKCIEQWQENNTQLYGIIHSHFNTANTLSQADIVYIKQIMLSINSTAMFFPIAFPASNKIISFKAKTIKNSEIIVIPDIIKII